MRSASSRRSCLIAATVLLVGCGQVAPDRAGSRLVSAPSTTDGPPDTVPNSTGEAPATTGAATAAEAPATVEPTRDPGAEVHTVGGLSVSLRVVRPTIIAGSQQAVFVDAIELPDGSVLATGVDTDDGGVTDRSALWRSTDGGGAFERLDLGHPTTLERSIDGFAEHEGVVYLFGHEGALGGAATVWISTDSGDTWDEQLIAGGSVSWGGIVGGLPTVTVSEWDATGQRTMVNVYQQRGDVWERSSVPDAGDGAFVWDVVELPNGTALAVGERCVTDPGYAGPGTCSAGRPDSTLDTLAWVSRDGGATWLDESAWLGGAPGAQSAGAAGTVGDAALIGITASTSQGDAFTIVLNSTTDGPSWGGFGTMPAWGGGSDPVWFEAIEPLGAGVLALVSTTSDGATRPVALIHDTASGAQELIELVALGPIRVFDLVTIGGTLYGVGVIAQDGSVAPVLVGFDVAA